MKHKFKNFQLTLETGGKEALEEIKRSFKSSKVNEEMINEAVQTVLAARAPGLIVEDVQEPEGGYLESGKFPKVSFIIKAPSYYALLRASANFRTGFNTVQSLTFFPGIQQLNQFERSYNEFLKENVSPDWRDLLFEETGYNIVLSNSKNLKLLIFKLKNLVEEYNLETDPNFTEFVRLAEEVKEDSLTTDLKYVTEFSETIGGIRFKADKESEEQLETAKMLEKLKRFIENYQDAMRTAFERR